MDPKDNKPSTPSRRSAQKEESDYLEADDCRTAVETESLTDARISRVPPPVTQSPRDAWANVAPTAQPRIADRDAQEIADSTQRALETLRNSADPRNRLFVPTTQSPSSSESSQPRRARSPFRPFSGQGRPLTTPVKGNVSSGVRTAVGASPAQSSIRTAAAISPDVRTGLEHSGRSARLKEMQQQQRPLSTARSNSRSRTSDVATAVSPAANSARSATKSAKSAKAKKAGCSTVHKATANYEIDLRSSGRRNSVTGPTTNVSTARTISPASRGRSPARPSARTPPVVQPYYDPDYPPLPSEGDPAEQTVDIIDKERAAAMYTPHISRPILFGTSGVRTATAISPARTMSERTARGDTTASSIKTARSPMSKSEKSLRTARPSPSPNSLGSYNTDYQTDRSISKRALSKTPRSNHKSHSQTSLATTSARSFGSNKTWTTATPSKAPCRKNLRAAHKSASATPATVSARSFGSDFSSKSSSGASRGRSARKPKTPLRTAAMHSARSTRSPATERTCVSPDAESSKRTPTRTPNRAAVRPHTPDTPAGWPYRTSDQNPTRQTSIRVAPSTTSLKTAAAARSHKSAKSPALRSQKELHREAKSGSSASRRARRSSAAPTSNVSTARTIASRAVPSHSATSSTQATKSNYSSRRELHSSKTNSRTFSAAELKAAKRDAVPVDAGPDMVIETVQAHGNIEIDLCFNFRVRAPPGQGFGETRSPLKPKEVLINGKPIWRQE